MQTLAIFLLAASIFNTEYARRCGYRGMGLVPFYALTWASFFLILYAP